MATSRRGGPTWVVLPTRSQGHGDTRHPTPSAESSSGFARGTRDVPPRTQTVRKRRSLATLAEARKRVESALRGSVLSTAEIVRATRLVADQVLEVLRVLRGENRVSALGSPERLVWVWRLGDRATADEVEARVRMLIARQPMTIESLVTAIGARARRVKRALSTILRSGARVVELPEDQGTRYMLLDRARRVRRSRGTRPQPDEN
jgi:hypothetical protein